MKDNSIFKYNAPSTTFDIPKPWSIAMRGNNLFVYWKDEKMPRFKFKKRHTIWTGHGIEARSIKRVMEWVIDYGSRKS